MTRRLTTHLIAMRRQLRRIQYTTLIGTFLFVLCVPMLLTTLQTGWLILSLGLLVIGYLWGILRRMVWTHRTMKQLRLEEQFIRHRPDAEHVVLCLRRHDHLWTQSLTLKSLRAITSAPTTDPASHEDHHERHRHQFLRRFSSLFSLRLPVNLLGLMSLLVLWLGSLPQSRLSAPSPALLIGAGVLLLVLLAETIHVVLRFDLRRGLDHLTTLLASWTQTSVFDEVLHTKGEKLYRHAPLYRSSLSILPPESFQGGDKAIPAK